MSIEWQSLDLIFQNREKIRKKATSIKTVLCLSNSYEWIYTLQMLHTTKPPKQHTDSNESKSLPLFNCSVQRLTDHFHYGELYIYSDSHFMALNGLLFAPEERNGQMINLFIFLCFFFQISSSYFHMKFVNFSFEQL